MNAYTANKSRAEVVFTTYVCASCDYTTRVFPGEPMPNVKRVWCGAPRTDVDDARVARLADKLRALSLCLSANAKRRYGNIDNQFDPDYIEPSEQDDDTDDAEDIINGYVNSYGDEI